MWINWRATICSEAGDSIILNYRDFRGQDGYELEYQKINLNGELFTEDHDIHEVLDKFLNDQELVQLFKNAERRPT